MEPTNASAALIDENPVRVLFRIVASKFRPTGKALAHALREGNVNATRSGGVVVIVLDREFFSISVAIAVE